MAPPRVYIHVGLPKTGTTYLQDRLWRNRDLALTAGGVLYPGLDIADHFHAAVHLQPGRYLDWVDPAHAEAWPRLVEQMRNWPGTSLLSHELFSTATGDQVGRVIDDLAFAEVHVIATVRDLGRQIPSVWQENVKNQRCAGLDDFFAAIRDAPRHETETDAALIGPESFGREPFWEFQDHVRILRTWGAHLPPERVHVVTVPPQRAYATNVVGRGTSGPDPVRDGAPAGGETTLWDRFLAVVGVDGAALHRSVPPSNTALSSAQIEMLRRVNHHLQPDVIEWPRYEYAVKRRLIGDILFANATRCRRTLDADQSDWAAARSEEMIRDIVAAGYDVVGDVDDLRVRPAVGGATGEPTTEDVLAVTTDALARVLATMPMSAPPRRLRTRAGAVARGGRRRLAAVRMRRRAR